MSDALKDPGGPGIFWARVTTFRELCASGEATCISPAEPVVLAAGIRNRPVPAFIDRVLQGSTATTEISYGIFKDCYILPRWLVLLDDGRLLLEDMVYYAPQNWLDGLGFITQFRVVDGQRWARIDFAFMRRVVALDAMMPIGGRKHHGHTLYDNFPRFDLIERVPALSAIPGLRFLRAGATPWNDFLFAGISEYLGSRVPQDRIDTWQGETLYRLKLGVIASTYRRRARPPRDAVRFLRRMLPPPARPVAGRRFYISRRDATAARSFANETAFAEMAERRFGAVPIELGRLTPAEQIAVMRGTELLVGVYGNGFSNAVFCPPGMTMVEVTAKGAICNLNIGVESGHRVIALDRDRQDQVDIGQAEQAIAAALDASRQSHG